MGLSPSGIETSTDGVALGDAIRQISAGTHATVVMMPLDVYSRIMASEREPASIVTQSGSTEFRGGPNLPPGYAVVTK